MNDLRCVKDGKPTMVCRRLAGLTKPELKRLVDQSYRNRITLVEMLIHSGWATSGGTSSAMDILTVLYEKILRHDPQNPKWPERDVFLLSAGHKAVGLYIVLQSVDYFDKSVLETHNTLHTLLPMHPDEKAASRHRVPTGALGHGLSVACGIATAFKMDGSSRRVFVMIGDGESNEGSVWRRCSARRSTGWTTSRPSSTSTAFKAAASPRTSCLSIACPPSTGTSAGRYERSAVTISHRFMPRWPNCLMKPAGQAASSPIRSRPRESPFPRATGAITIGARRRRTAPRPSRASAVTSGDGNHWISRRTRTRGMGGPDTVVCRDPH